MTAGGKAEAKAEADAANQAAIDARKRAAANNSGPAMSDAAIALPTPFNRIAGRHTYPIRAFLEPIQEVWIQRQGFDLVKRRSMMWIMARRMKAATVLP